MADSNNPDGWVTIEEAFDFVKFEMPPFGEQVAEFIGIPPVLLVPVFSDRFWNGLLP